MSDNVREFPSLSRLSAEEKGTLISLLVQYEGKTALVRDDFRYIYDKKISIKTVKAVAHFFEEEIEEQAKKLAKDAGLNPLARRSYRYKLLWALFKRAMQVRLRGYYRMNKDTWKEDIRDDPNIALRCLELAERMEIGPEGMEIKRAQLVDVQVGTDEGDDFEMDDGLSVG